MKLGREEYLLDFLGYTFAWAHAHERGRRQAGKEERRVDGERVGLRHTHLRTFSSSTRRRRLVKSDPFLIMAKSSRVTSYFMPRAATLIKFDQKRNFNLRACAAYTRKVFFGSLEDVVDSAPDVL